MIYLTMLDIKVDAASVGVVSSTQTTYPYY